MYHSSTAISDGDRPISRRHGYRFIRPPTDPEWAAFRVAARGIERLALTGQLGPCPDPRFRGAAKSGTEIVAGEDGLTIRGKGVHRLHRGGGSLSMGSAPLHLSRHLRGWSCETRGRPYDTAIRMALLLLHAAAPDAVRVSTGGTDEEWRQTERVAAAELGIPAKLPPHAGVRVRKPRPKLAAVAERAAADPRISVHPVQGTDLWRAQAWGAEIVPVGRWALRVGERTGFGGRMAALLAASEAAARFSGAAGIEGTR